jgi:hypothetical protein
MPGGGNATSNPTGWRYRLIGEDEVRFERMGTHADLFR